MVDLISISEDREPYVKKLTEDKIINLTGQSGSGKSTYAKNHFYSDDYIIIDTDILLRDKEGKQDYYRDIMDNIKKKYRDRALDLGTDFDEIYQEILSYFKDSERTIVIDCAQFHCIKNVSALKGTVIVMRTAIDNCYSRCIERYKENHPDCTDEELEKYKERKKKIYDWVKWSNEFLKKLDAIEVEKEDR